MIQPTIELKSFFEEWENEIGHEGCLHFIRDLKESLHANNHHSLEVHFEKIHHFPSLLSTTKGEFLHKVLEQCLLHETPFRLVEKSVQFWQICQKYRLPLEKLVSKLSLEKKDIEIESAYKLGKRYKTSFHNFLSAQIQNKAISVADYLYQAKIFEEVYAKLEMFFLDHLAYLNPPTLKSPRATHPIYIDVFMSHGGGGHITASQEIYRLLHGRKENLLIRGKWTLCEYVVRILDPCTEFLWPLDPLTKACKRKYSGVDMYNFFLRKGWHLCAQILVHGGNFINGKRKKEVIKNTLAFLERQDRIPAHLIISTIPSFNHGFLAAIKTKNIPFIITPTDLETYLFSYGITEKDARHPYFKFGLPSSDALVRLKLAQRSPIRAENIETMGFPSRQECRKTYLPEDIVKLKQNFALNSHTKIVTLVAGAQGGKSMLKHVSVLLNIQLAQPLEFNVCTGKNTNLLKQICELMHLKKAQAIHSMPGVHSFLIHGITFHIRPFFKDLISLMAISDIVVTKTGTCTVMEAVQLALSENTLPHNLFLLLDNTKSSSARRFMWERFNIPYVNSLNIGTSFSSSRELKQQIIHFLTEVKEVHKMKTSLSNFSLMLPYTVQNLLLQKAQQG